MKKKILTLALVVVMIAIMLTSFTMAYFTDIDAKHNEIAVGKVDIELVEKVTDDKLVPVDTQGMGAGTADTARVGNKVVDIKNNGDQDAYVRLLIAVEDTKDVGAATFINSAYATGGIKWGATSVAEDKLVGFKSNGDYLQIEDSYGTVYTVYAITLSEPLAAGATTESNTWPLLKGILIKNTADNAWSKIVGDKYDVLVLAQGAQIVDSTKTAGDNIDTAYGFTLDNDADADVAALFTQAGLGGFQAHTYTAEGAWTTSVK